MVPWEKTVLSQTPSGHAAVGGRGREESADLRSMRMWGFSHRPQVRAFSNPTHPGDKAAGMNRAPGAGRGCLSRFCEVIWA
jgi:hypothetical protein